MTPVKPFNEGDVVRIIIKPSYLWYPFATPKQGDVGTVEGFSTHRDADGDLDLYVRVMVWRTGREFGFAPRELEKINA